ncbi:Holliday junction branch migration protein RuvA [Magnetococcales bacterium HHB-1]
MIAHLSGRLTNKEPGFAIIECAGVGYQVFLPYSTFLTLPKVGREMSLRTVLQVREDAMTLYGFGSEEEREAFNALIAVSGIGAKLALAALSTLSPADLSRAVGDGDLTTLSRIPGVGKKTAQRMVMELKDRLPVFVEVASIGAQEPAPTEENSALRTELTSALTNLGFKRPEVDRALNHIFQEPIHSLEEGLPKALKILTSV